ncbi:DUF503 domain-containing protein [Clostridiaceae bacterium M8S5]|nr:DUF503 domain-containing protein [Clostridiaceae bacterium M8S5]
MILPIIFRDRFDEVMSVIIGSCSVELMVFESNSLKEKRHVIKSILGRIQSKFNVSIAEVGFNDLWNKSEIGFACVTNDSTHANSMISKILNYIERDNRVEVLNVCIEIL